MNDLTTAARASHSADGLRPEATGAPALATSVAQSERKRMYLARSLLRDLWAASKYDPQIDASSAGVAEVAQRLIGQRRLGLARSLLSCLSTASMYDPGMDTSSAGVCEVAYRLISSGSAGVEPAELHSIRDADTRTGGSQ